MRRAPAEAFVGDEVRVDLVIANPTRKPRLWLSVRDPFVARSVVYLEALGPEGSTTLSTRRVAARRGVVDGGPVVVSTSAPFGVAEVRRNVPAAGRVVVFPRIVPVAAMPFLADPSGGSELKVARGRGEGREFHGIREYQRGDSLRHVHWPSTARHGSLVVREFERERPARVTVVVDTHGDSIALGDEETALDRCCSAAASVALEALRLGHGVTVAAARDGRLAVLEDADRTGALTLLAEARASGGMTLAEAVAATPDSPTVLVAFPTWRSNSAALLVPAVERLVVAGSRVAAVAVEVAPATSRAEPALSEAGTDELMVALAAAGADATLVRAGGTVADALSSAFAGAAR